MQTRNPFLNDFSKLLTGAFGIAQNARSEMETVFNSMFERWLSERNLVTREEFDAVRLMVQSACEKNVELEAKIGELQAKLSKKNLQQKKSPSKK